MLVQANHKSASLLQQLSHHNSKAWYFKPGKTLCGEAGSRLRPVKALYPHWCVRQNWLQATSGGETRNRFETKLSYLRSERGDARIACARPSYSAALKSLPVLSFVVDNIDSLPFELTHLVFKFMFLLLINTANWFKQIYWVYFIVFLNIWRSQLRNGSV